MSDNGIGLLILIVGLFGGGLMLMLLFTIFKGLITSVFNLDYEDLKFNLKEAPQSHFVTPLSSINLLVFRGFWVSVELYSDFIIFKMFNRALVVKDFSQLSLTGSFTSKLVLVFGKTRLELALGKKEYKIMKEFLEDKNV